MDAVTIVLGLWLFTSAFVWLHAPTVFTSTWIVGLLVALFGGLSIRRPLFRYANALLGAWLVASSIFLSDVYRGTAWHNGTLGVLLLLLSIGPFYQPGRQPEDVFHSRTSLLPS
jgi:hypothetical protein